MIPDILYDLALKFKKTKLWMTLNSSQLFAVKHSDGTYGYCCIMGMVNEYIALAVYPGEAGLASYRSIGISRDNMDPFERHEVSFSQDCVMLSFQNKSDLLKREVEEIKAYTVAHDAVLRGRKAYPRFERFRPHYIPWRLEDPIDQLHLREALEAAFEVHDKLTLATPESIGFTDGEPYHREIPLLEKIDDTFTWGTVALFEPRDVQYLSPEIEDEIALAKLKRCKKRGGEWACDIFMHLEPMSDGEQDGLPIEELVNAPCFPYVLLVVDIESEMIIAVHSVKELNDIVPLLTSLVEAALGGGKPSKIAVCNQRAYAFFKKLAPLFGSKLVRRKHIRALEEAKQSFAERFGGPHEKEDKFDYDLLLTVLSDLSNYADMPNEMLVFLKSVVRQCDIPSVLVGYVEQECKKRGI